MSPPVQAMNSAPSNGPKPAEDHLGIPVLSETGRDACVDGGDLFVQSQDRPGQGVHHGGGCALPGHGGVLGLRRGDRRIGHGLAPRTLRFFSQAASRLGPIRRRPAGVC